MAKLVLSLFPGVDLFGRAFEAAGFCVVRGPDVLWGGDVRAFHPVAGKFDGVIGGPPCVDYSSLRRVAATGEGDELVGEFLRVVYESGCEWFCMENVPRVPSVTVQGFEVQRVDVCGQECGMRQQRRRHFQFGQRVGRQLLVRRDFTRCDTRMQPAAVAGEGRNRRRRSWVKFCELQGVTGLALPGMTWEGRYRAVGNGVPLPMGRLIAEAVREWTMASESMESWRLCRCGCGRVVTHRGGAATVACRKRLERQRSGAGVAGRFVSHLA